MVRNWPTWFWSLKSPKICSWQMRPRKAGSVSSSLSPRDRESGKSRVSVPVWGQEKASVPAQQSSKQRSLLLSLSGLFRPSFDWMRPTHVREGHLLSPVRFGYYLIQKQPQRHTLNHVWRNGWEASGPLKLTHETNRHPWDPQSEFVLVSVLVITLSVDAEQTFSVVHLLWVARLILIGSLLQLQSAVAVLQLSGLGWPHPCIWGSADCQLGGWAMGLMSCCRHARISFHDGCRRAPSSSAFSSPLASC